MSIRPALETLSELDEGRFMDKLALAIHDATNGVTGLSKPAKVTITLDFAPLTKQNLTEPVITVEAEITTKLPKPDAPARCSTSASEKCGHGKLFVGETCDECEAVWVRDVTLPNVRRGVGQLLKFYQKETLIELIFAQAQHIEKLQSKAPPLRDDWPRKVREG